MNGIGDYLKRYIGIHTVFEEKKNIFTTAFLEVLHTDVSKKTIQIKGSVVSVSGLNSSERTMLFLRKKDLVEMCSKKGLIITEIK